VADEPLEQLRAWRADVAIVLGSGLNSLVCSASDQAPIPYSAFPDIPPPSVEGHAGRFVLGVTDATHVIFAHGRAHLYEGHSAERVTAGVRVLAGAGVTRLILTNAAGTANPAFAPGSWMMISDHLNFTGTTPLLGRGDFVDMTEVYSPAWRSNFRRAARSCGMPLHEGVYAGLLGPQYETPAEVRMLRTLGADAIGMSTVLEAIQARALGVEVVAFSCLTNWAAGIQTQHLSHTDVLETGQVAAADFGRLLGAVFAG
jgi:purine-nucleoside phosphorylase